MLGIDEFEIYQNNNTKTLHSNYVYRYALPFEKVQDKVGWTFFFQKYWYHSITISLFYYLFVCILQRLMRYREPFQLKIPLIIWNFMLTTFSFIGLIRFSEDFLYNLEHHGLVFSLCHSCNPDSVAAFWSLMFAFSKIIEFGDTLFIVLRKRELIFLHYYHHAAVFVYTIHSGTEHTAPGQAFISMNFFVHSVMYLYYLAKSSGLNVSRSIALMVTCIQTAQMFLGVAVSTLVLKLKLWDGYRCQQSWANLILAFSIYVSFAILFSRFLNDTYLKPWRKQKKE